MFKSIHQTVLLFKPEMSRVVYVVYVVLMHVYVHFLFKFISRFLCLHSYESFVTNFTHRFVMQQRAGLTSKNMALLSFHTPKKSCAWCLRNRPSSYHGGRISFSINVPRRHHFVPISDLFPPGSGAGPVGRRRAL